MSSDELLVQKCEPVTSLRLRSNDEFQVQKWGPGMSFGLERNQIQRATIGGWINQ